MNYDLDMTADDLAIKLHRESAKYARVYQQSGYTDMQARNKFNEYNRKAKMVERMIKQFSKNT